MAQRFGGKFSPDGTGPARDHGPAPVQPAGPHPFDGKAPAKAGGRVNMLFAVALMMAGLSFMRDREGLVLGLVSGGILLAAAFLIREGLRAEEAYDARRVARRPAFPRKAFGAALIGVGVATAALYRADGLLYPGLFGALGAGLAFLAFGPDPMRDKGAEGVDQFQNDRIARAVDEAEGYLAAMSDAILRAGDRALEGRVERFAATARAMFRTIEGDPGDLTAARKYLTVYLMGARDATVKFADHYARSRDAKARTDYEALLTDLETNFASRTQALLTDNRSDLDVEIEVLRERLKREA